MRNNSHLPMDAQELAAIVDKVELKLSKFIINPLRKICLKGCKCNRCFHEALDNLVFKSEVAATGFRLENDKIYAD
jgi:hypothetical protein